MCLTFTGVQIYVFHIQWLYVVTYITMGTYMASFKLKKYEAGTNKKSSQNSCIDNDSP